VQAIGRSARLVGGFEATYGATPAVPTCVVLPFISNGVKSTQNQTGSEVITGTRDPVEPSLGNVKVAGTNVVPVDVTAFGYWLKSLLGAPTSTGTATCTHIFTTRATSIPSMILETQHADIGVYRLNNGCKVSSLSMSFGGDGELTASIDIIGSKETIAATAVASATTISLTKFNNFQAVLKEGGATAGNCTAVDFKIESGLDDTGYVIGGGGFLGQLPEGMFMITGNVKAFFENSTLLNKAINGTESSLQITLTNGVYSLDILLSELKYARNSPSVDNSKGILIDLPFTAYYQNDAGNTACKITLINTQASY
jgi:hypothetical protein